MLLTKSGVELPDGEGVAAGTDWAAAVEEVEVRAGMGAGVGVGIGIGVGMGSGVGSGVRVGSVVVGVVTVVLVSMGVAAQFLAHVSPAQAGQENRVKARGVQGKRCFSSVPRLSVLLSLLPQLLLCVCM